MCIRDRDVAVHIEMAARASDASDGVETHASHITTIARTVKERAEKAADVARRLQVATSIRRASPLVAQLRLLVYQIAEGGDTNSDGDLSLAGEAGLQQLEAHAYLVLEAEGSTRIIR